ncbi:MAG: DUF4041 domain-containing protein [Limisphaerales bacterium]
MTIFLIIIIIGCFVALWFLKKQLTSRENQITQIQSDTQRALREIQAANSQQITEYQQYGEMIRAHYETEAQRLHEEMMETYQLQHQRIESLQRFEELEQKGENVKERLMWAMQQAEHLQSDAEQLVELAKQNAEDIAGEAYEALDKKELLDQQIIAIENTIHGYGDRYVVPSQSVLDELAESYEHAEAGVQLAAARSKSKSMVTQQQAASCDYNEVEFNEAAVRFVIGAFNGRVDAILAKSKHDNFGTLKQKISDVFNLINLNGVAFGKARIEASYLQSRLQELQWAVAVHELKKKEREEQRLIKEQMREEERARKEYEKTRKKAEEEQRLLDQAMREAAAVAERAKAAQQRAYEEKMAEMRRQLEAANQSEQQISDALRMAEIEAERERELTQANSQRELEQLQTQLAEAEARNQRSLSMAQQTKSGYVYVISNEGSFGSGVLKIGMTRRLEPMDRVKELSDASVPFEFDVHAMISSEDAPTLEKDLHRQFHEHRVNKVNFRKEFFRIPLQNVRETLVSIGIEASFTMMAEAHEYRESKSIDAMSKEERGLYYTPA